MAGRWNTALQADCAACFGLCCVALPYAKGADFAFDKSGGVPCQHLQHDHRCGIHSQLRAKGMKGCTVYDCFGAGQQLSQVTYGGIDWRERPEKAKEMYDALPVMRQLYELLWYLREVLEWPDAAIIHAKAEELYAQTVALTELSGEKLLQVDLMHHRALVNEQLLHASELVRKAAERTHGKVQRREQRVKRGADLIGAKLARRDLRYSSMRGALVIAADLRDSHLGWVDCIGADFRDADIRGANMEMCLYLTQMQVNAAKGNGRTRLPQRLLRPSHWE